MPLLNVKKLKKSNFTFIGNNMHHEAKQLTNNNNKRLELKNQKELNEGTPNLGGSRIQNIKFNKSVQKKIKSLIK
jgi:lipid A disaccharide synthetase